MRDLICRAFCDFVMLSTVEISVREMLSFAESFSWCGYLFDMQTLEGYLDFSSFLGQGQ